MKFGKSNINLQLCSCSYILNNQESIVVYRQFESLCEPFGAAIYRLLAVCESSAKGLFFTICSICSHRTKPAPYCHRRENCTRLISSRPYLISRRPHPFSTTSRPTFRRSCRSGCTTCLHRPATPSGRYTTTALTLFVCS